MTDLIQQAAAARAEARRLRVEDRLLRAALRRQRSDVRQIVHRCTETMRHTNRRRLRVLPSAWSSLEWLPPGRELDTVLVPIDGDA